VERVGTQSGVSPNREGHRDRYREHPTESHHKYDDRRSGHTGYRKKRSLFDVFDFD
jgi:hypothetical protein